MSGISVHSSSLLLIPIHLTDSGQWIADEYVYRAGAAKPFVHHDHVRQLLAHLADDSRLYLLFEYVRCLEGDGHQSLYETFRSSLSAIQTLIMD